MTNIHSTAIVDKDAQIAKNVTIGPFSIVGPNVSIDEGSTLISHCTVTGHTKIGKNNKIYQNTTIGGPPQDFDFKNTISFLNIGDNNIFREGVTINVGTKENSSTEIGNKNYFMINSHVAHNCIIRNNVILVNGALLAGYVELEDGVIVGGNSMVHQFCRVGRLSFISGSTGVTMELPPFMVVVERNSVKNVNILGLRRSGMTREAIKAIRSIYKIFYKRALSVPNAIKTIKEELPQLPEVKEFIDFVENSSKRGVISSS